MNTPEHHSERASDYFDGLATRKADGQRLTVAEESYCWAMENGFSSYVADLMYMEQDGQALSPAEQTYLTAVLDGANENDAEQAAYKTESIYPEFEQDAWDDVVRTSRDRFFTGQNESEASSEL